MATLRERVEQLEAARMVTAVEIGGFVFTDEASTEAWVATHCDPDLLRFSPDFVTLFLLADPKFDTVEAGLEQSAAVAKAQFSSLDVATAVLSYSIIYPSNVIKKSDKTEAQQDGGVTWAPPFASHAVFEGDYNNGTRLRLKRFDRRRQVCGVRNRLSLPSIPPPEVQCSVQSASQVCSYAGR